MSGALGWADSDIARGERERGGTRQLLFCDYHHSAPPTLAACLAARCINKVCLHPGRPRSGCAAGPLTPRGSHGACKSTLIGHGRASLPSSGAHSHSFVRGAPVSGRPHTPGQSASADGAGARDPCDTVRQRPSERSQRPSSSSQASATSSPVSSSSATRVARATVAHGSRSLAGCPS